MAIKIEHRVPSVEEYQQLRHTTDWDKIDDSMVATMLSNTLFAVCISVNGRIAAFGRIIGDGAYFYIQDVIVLPDYKMSGLGRNVMRELENWIEKSVKPKAFIGLMAAKGTIEFYRKFNYEIRSNDKPGMFKIKK